MCARPGGWPSLPVGPAAPVVATPQVAPVRRATPDWTEVDEAALQAYVATIGTKPRDRYEDIWNPGTEAETTVARTVRKNPYPTTATMPRRDETIAA